MNFVKFIKQIGHDIRIGQNIDIYLGILISAIVAFLSIFNITNQNVVFSALLAVMALVTYSILGNRRQNEEIKDVLSNLKDPRSLAARFLHKEDDITEIIQIIRASQEVVLWGYTLSSHIPILQEEIENGLDRGLQVKILLIEPRGVKEPSGAALKMAAFRGRGEDQTLENELNKRLEDNLRILKMIKKDRPSAKLQYKVINYFAPYTMYIYDPYLPNGKMMVRLSALEVSNAERPTYYLTKKDDVDWFNFHVKQFEKAWNRAKDG